MPLLYQWRQMVTSDASGFDHQEETPDGTPSYKRPYGLQAGPCSPSALLVKFTLPVPSTPILYISQLPSRLE